MKDYNEDISDEKVSRINSAGIINITLENLWRDSYSAMKAANLVLWNRSLDCIWAILGGDIPKGHEKENEFIELQKKIYECGSLSHKVKGFDTESINEDNANKQYQLLLQKSLFLRRLQNKQGKGTAYFDDEDDDLD